MTDKPAFRISPPLAALGLFVVVAIGFGIWFALQKAPLPLEISERTTVVTTPLDERGRIDYETPLNDILGRGVTPETNALILLTRVLGPRPEGGRGMPSDWWKRLGAEAPPEDGDYLKDDSSKWMYDLMFGDNGEETIRKQAMRDEEDRLRVEPWTTKDSPHYVEWLKANDKPLSLAAEAVKMQHYFHPLIARDKDGKKQDLYNALLPYVQKMRAIANILSIRAMWHLGEGRADAAWADLMTIHRLSGLMILNPGSLIDYLVGVAIRTIAMQRMVKVIEVAKPDLAQLTRWKNEFHAMPVAPNWEKIFGMGQRYMALDFFLAIKEAVAHPEREWPSGIIDSKESIEEMRRLRLRIDWNAVFTNYNTALDEAIKNLKLLTQSGVSQEVRKEADEALLQLRKRIYYKPPDNENEKVKVGLTGLMLPATEKIAFTYLRIQQHTTFLSLMFDLEEHRLKHGSYPETAVDYTYSRDIFTGETIRYKRLPNGYYLHSFGQNQKDDFNEQFDESAHGDDVVVKVIRK